MSASRVRLWLDALERVSLGTRLTVLVTVPLVVIALISVLALSDRWRAASEGSDLIQQLESVALIEDAVRAVQEERGITVRLRMEPSDGFGAAALRVELEDARRATDQAILATGLDATIPADPASDARMDTLVRSAEGGGRPPDLARTSPGSGPGGPPPPDSGGAVPAPPAQIETLDQLRRNVDSMGSDFWRSLGRYSSLVGKLQEQALQAFLDAEEASSYSEHSSPLLAYYHVRVAEEALAELRDLGVGYVDEPPLVQAAALAQIMDTEWSHLLLAAQLGDHRQRVALESLTTFGAAGVGGDLRRLLFAGTTTPNPGRDPGVPRPTITGREWLDATAERADLMQQTADSLRQQLVDDVAAWAKLSSREFWLILALTMFLLSTVAFGAWAVSRSISRPLHRLALTAQLAAVGHITAVDVPPSQDALGEIGAAMEELRARSDEMARAAEVIASGDLSGGIEPRSGGDRLGWALRTMTQRLTSMVGESEQRSARLAGEVSELQATASRDALTGLANRRRFSHLLKSGLAAAQVDGTQLGLLFIDLDGFKQVNDTLGHDVGDELLRRVSDRLRTVVGPGDSVGRFGGDEFTVIVKRRPGDEADHVRTIARRVVETLTIGYNVEGRNVRLGASVGVALYPEHGDSTASLLRASDQAMYAAKQSGGGVRFASVPEAAA